MKDDSNVIAKNKRNAAWQYKDLAASSLETARLYDKAAKNTSNKKDKKEFKQKVKKYNEKADNYTSSYLYELRNPNGPVGMIGTSKAARNKRGYE